MHRWLRLHHVHRHRTAAHTAGIILLLAGTSVVAVGIALAFFHWTGVPADETAMTTGTFIRNGPYPGCEDTATFKVGDRRYTVQVRSFMASGYSSAQGLCGGHRVGTQVSVAYSPSDPAQASVQFNQPLLKWIAYMFVGALFGFLGWLFIPPPREEHLGPSMQIGPENPAALLGGVLIGSAKESVDSEPGTVDDDRPNP
jgi:hypothetical protein